MADISKITLPDGSEYDLKDARAREIPLESRTYTNIIATANDNNGGGFFYLKVRGTTYDSKWKVKVHVHATVPGNVNYNTDSDFIIWGRQNTYSSFFCWNNIFNTSYRPIYYNSVFFVSSTGYTNNCANWIGFNLYNSTNPIDTSYKRSITVDLLSYENCTVELQDTLITPTNIPNRAAHTNWYSSTYTSYSNFDACSNGLKQTGDANTTNITNVYSGNGSYVAHSALYRYQLLFQTDENTLTPLTNANNVIAATKTMLTDVEFDPFGRIFYYNTTTAAAAGGVISAGTLYYALSGFDARYGFNITTSTFTAHKPFYLVVTPLSNGKCKIASTTPWAQSLPSSNDGKWYIFIGRTYSGYQISLYPYHPVYYHDGVSIKQAMPPCAVDNAKTVNGHTVGTDVPSNAVFTDTTYTAATSAPGKVASSSSVGTSTNYARQDHTHGIDLATGDSNGQVKIAGTNVNVKGLASAAYTESSAYLASSLKGANSGVAELDSSGKVPTSQLPSYVDDVLEYTSKSSFPATGETGKIYVDTGTNLTYRWSGSAYVEISPSLALGTTSSTAFRGDYGNSAYAHAVTNKGSAFSSGLYKITTNSEGHVTAATAVVKADITGLGIPGSDTNTHRPIKVNSTQILGDNTTALNLAAGSNMSITSDANGNVTFAASGSAMPFMIVQQPVPVGISADNTIVTFSIVLAGGTGSYTYQWQLMSGGTAWIDLGGSQGSSIDILGHLVTDTIHRCVVSDGVTTLYSNPVYYYGTNSGTTGVKQSINDGNYGVCSTAAGTAAKTVSIPGLIVQPGVTIHVKFTNTNSASNPTLAVNSTPAKSIVLYGTTAIGTTAETTGWNAGAVVALTYDGTYWIRDQGYNTNTTYSNATTSSAGLMSAADKTAVNALKNLSTLEYEIVS